MATATRRELITWASEHQRIIEHCEQELQKLINTREHELQVKRICKQLAQHAYAKGGIDNDIAARRHH